MTTALDLSRRYRFVHYSAEPLTQLLPLPLVETQAGYMKPKAFWFSVDGNGDGWKDWCLGEEFNLDALVHETEIGVASHANLLCLQSAEELDAFTIKYGSLNSRFGMTEIDWTKVMTYYDGLIIAPYCYLRRLSQHTHWYYGWDCASGAVWNIDAITIAGAAS